MKVSKVLLRWYKSFNTNYAGYSDRRNGVVQRPWNLLGVETQDASDYPFIEIPIETDITTVVGANESGKSHLLDAISKVIRGFGIDDIRSKSRSFDRTDLCLFASLENKNAEAWPHIGLEFIASASELERVMAAANGNAVSSPGSTPYEENDDQKNRNTSTFVLILAPDNSTIQAYLYIDVAQRPIALDAQKLADVRRVLPKVEFIKSNIPLAAEISLGALIQSYGGQPNTPVHAYDQRVAQAAAEFLENMQLPAANTPVTETLIQQFQTMRNQVSSAHLTQDTKMTLERQLFRDILDIKVEALQYLAGLGLEDRSSAEGLTARWNVEIEERLNLSRYWQQDDEFSLRISYKQGMIYFEITDRTGSVYTFKERSSGLRYFLSYYIQAKALEISTRSTNTIIMMDEPDSFLSIMGQRNLLAVFESLVAADTSKQRTQLIYTTHSPYLINRNFPRRSRLVRKGYAEEGTQFIDGKAIRRYEPVRSAMGIDTSQSLFMGATNLILEGPVDQYLLSELIRIFATPDNLPEYLDLNSIATISAGSASRIEKVIDSSRWGDEPMPATVVLFDNDEAGQIERDKITKGVDEEGALISEDYVLLISDAVGEQRGEHHIKSTEDLAPSDLYAQAVRDYFMKWHPGLIESKGDEINRQLSAPEYSQNGLTCSTKALFKSVVSSNMKDYDKFGVAQELVRIVEERVEQTRRHANGGTVEFDTVVTELNARLKLCCQKLRQTIEISQGENRKQTGKQAIVRVIHDFLKKSTEAASVYETLLLFERIEREMPQLGHDDANLQAVLGIYLKEIRDLREEGVKRLTEDTWKFWKSRIEKIRRNPLSPEMVHKLTAPNAVTVAIPELQNSANQNGQTNGKAVPKSKKSTEAV